MMVGLFAISLLCILLFLLNISTILIARFTLWGEGGGGVNIQIGNDKCPQRFCCFFNGHNWKMYLSPFVS